MDLSTLTIEELQKRIEEGSDDAAGCLRAAETMIQEDTTRSGGGPAFATTLFSAWRQGDLEIRTNGDGNLEYRKTKGQDNRIQKVTDVKTGQLVLQKLRKAISLQVILLDTCTNHINHIFDYKSDAVSRVVEVTPHYTGKQLTEADLDAIVAGLEELNPYVPIGQRKKLAGMESLDKATRRILLAAFQDAITLQNEIWLTTRSLAEILEYDMNYLWLFIQKLAAVTDTGMEVGEMDLKRPFQEPEAEGYTRAMGSLSPPLLN